jgi:hypothetical protein
VSLFKLSLLPGQTDAAPRTKRLACYACAVTLTADESHHYGYQCHDCVVREHELILLWRSDPDHPDTHALHRSPVDIGLS